MKNEQWKLFIVLYTSERDYFSTKILWPWGHIQTKYKERTDLILINWAMKDVDRNKRADFYLWVLRALLWLRGSFQYWD